MPPAPPWPPLLLLVATLVLVGLAYAVLGAPRWSAARDFLTSDWPAGADAGSAAQAALWLVALAALAAALVAAVRGLVKSGAVRRHTLAWSVAVLLAGLVVLAAGAGRHVQRTTLTMSGGSAQEARAELAR